MTLSFMVHLTLFFVATYSGLLMAPRLREAPVYYVDVVNMPVASPRAGSPTVAGNQAAPVPQPPAPRETMQLPAKTPPKAAKGTPAAKAPPATREETSREFEERLKQLERSAEAQHQAAALEALKNKSAGGTGKGAAGMPAGTGKDAGSDYASYIHSRLKDVFRSTIAYQSKNPEILVRLTIGRSGRLLRYRIERSSGDKVFEASVVATITKAEKSFPPPPGGAEFEQGFLFKPQGIGKN